MEVRFVRTRCWIRQPEFFKKRDENLNAPAKAVNFVGKPITCWPNRIGLVFFWKWQQQLLNSPEFKRDGDPLCSRNNCSVFALVDGVEWLGVGWLGVVVLDRDGVARANAMELMTTQIPDSSEILVTAPKIMLQPARAGYGTRNHFMARYRKQAHQSTMATTDTVSNYKGKYFN